MPIRQMYPAVAFSPQAHLAVDIDATTDTIPLTTTAYLPAGPNRVSIMDGANSETIAYTAIAGNDLTGCTRGVEGGAHTHAAMRPVARFYCAADHDEITGNLDYLFAQQPIGIEWDTAGSDTTALQRIDLEGVAVTSLPFNSFDEHATYRGIRRCLLSPTGVPTYGSNARGDGLDLSGASGRVMVSIPKFFVKADSPESGVYRWWISPVPMSGFEVHPAFRQRGGVEQDCIFVSAYEAALLTRDHPAHAVSTLALHSKSGEQPATGDGCIKTLAFTSGGTTAFTIGETLTGTTSGATGVIVDWALSSGTWAGGDAAGTLVLKAPTGAFASENLNGSAAGSNCCTVGGAATTITLTVDQARTYAENIGPGWGLMNVWTRGALILLMAIEFGTWNGQGALGRGVVDLAAGTGFAGRVTGYGSADLAPQMAANGTGLGLGTPGQTPVSWRGIENPWGNVGKFVDGAVVSGYYAYVAPRDGVAVIGLDEDRPVERSATTLATATGYISALHFEALTRYLLLPGAVAGAAGTYCCDYATLPGSAGENGAVVAGGSWAVGDQAGPLAVDASTDPLVAYARTYGARLEFVGPEGVDDTTTIMTVARTAAIYPPPATTASQPTAPSVAYDDDGVGTLAWKAAQKAVRQDGGATLAAAGAGTTHYLIAQGYGFNIPASAIIAAIYVDLYRYVVAGDASNYVVDSVVKLVKPGGTLSATSKADAVTHWGGTLAAPETAYYDDATWGETWTPAMINHGDFGVAVSATTTSPAGTCAPAIDFVGVRVAYTI